VRGVAWEWASLDSAIVKAPKGGDATGPNPTDRGKSGVKRHILTDGRGVPLAAEITAANVHDKRAAIPTVDAIVVRAPRGPRRPTNLCLDKDYDFDDVDREIRARGIQPQSDDAARSRGVAVVVERDDGSRSERTRGTTDFAPCSFAGSERVPTTWHSSISRAP
jgi:putative transposase